MRFGRVSENWKQARGLAASESTLKLATRKPYFSRSAVYCTCSSGEACSVSASLSAFSAERHSSRLAKALASVTSEADSSSGVVER